MFWSVSSQVLQGASMLRGSLSFLLSSAQLVELPLSSAALGKNGPAGAIPVMRTIFSWQRYSATFWNAVGGISVSSQPCSIVHSSRTPSLESPSDGFEAESIHSYHAEQEAPSWPTACMPQYGRHPLLVKCRGRASSMLLRCPRTTLSPSQIGAQGLGPVLSRLPLPPQQESVSCVGTGLP